MNLQLISVLKRFFLLFTWVWCSNVFAVDTDTDKPNLVVIMCDDVSYDMFGCYGNEDIHTPNIDALASAGVSFETAWNSAICSPARAEIMTGKYATATGYWYNTFHLPMGHPNDEFFSEHIPFSKILNDDGYSTAVAGKWHIGVTEHQNVPAVGFDECCMWVSLSEMKGQIGIDSWDGGYESPGKTARYWHPCIIENGELLSTGPQDFGPDICSDFICDFIKRKTDVGEPFLAYYPMTLPHGPNVEMPTRTTEGSNYPNDDSEISNSQRFAEMVEYIDILVGKIITQLKTSGAYENTVVVFTADNGTGGTAKTRGVERGCHIPMIIAGHGIKQRGMTAEICDATDIHPTLVELGGATMPADVHCDGQSLVPFITGATETHKELIHACIGTTQLLRTKTHLLEVVNPVLGVPDGRFYYCGDCRIGTNYVRAEGVPEHADVLANFKEVLANQYIGLKKDYPYLYEGLGLSFMRTYIQDASIEKHIHNHKNYILYDESVTIDESTKWVDPDDNSTDLIDASAEDNTVLLQAVVAGNTLKVENIPLNVTYSIYSSNGIKVKAGNFSLEQENIQITDFSPGVYFLALDAMNISPLSFVKY